jgi:hypothetical protein
MLRGVVSSLHLTVPFMNRLNQTEFTTFSILPCWTFFRDSYFLYCLTLMFMYYADIFYSRPTSIGTFNSKKYSSPSCQNNISRIPLNIKLLNFWNKSALLQYITWIWTWKLRNPANNILNGNASWAGSQFVTKISFFWGKAS